MTITPRGSKSNPIPRRVRQISRTNTSLIIGIPWELAALAEIKADDKYLIYIDFPDRNKIVLERVKR